MQQQVPVDSAFGEFRPLSRRNPPTRAAPMTEPIQRTGGSSYASVLKNQVIARGASQGLMMVVVSKLREHRIET